MTHYCNDELIRCLVLRSFLNVLLNTGNILILRSISVYKELQTPTNLFLASLAVADLLITLLLPIYAVSMRNQGTCIWSKENAYSLSERTANCNKNAFQ